MNNRLSAADVRSVHRFVDGAMSDPEAAEFRRRLASEPQLRLEAQGLQSLSAGFVAGRTAGPGAPADFTRQVMRSVHQVALDQSWRQHVVDDSQVVHWCRRILLVAAALFLVAAVWRSGLLPGQKPDSLQAAPDVLQLEMQRLDARIRDTVGPASKLPAGAKRPGEQGPGEPRPGEKRPGDPPSAVEGPRRK